MLYFIPAWYAQDEWKEDEQFWHRRRMKTEIDDTVKQIQLFWRNARLRKQNPATVLRTKSAAFSAQAERLSGSILVRV